MADLPDHCHQAIHNEKCAKLILATDGHARDWSITAAFYSAIHLVEAAFTTKPDIGHSEAADRGGLSPHDYRQKMVFELAPPAFESYRKLREVSRTVRYLSAPSQYGGVPALEYVTEADARDLIGKKLSTVRDELEKAFGVNLH